MSATAYLPNPSSLPSYRAFPAAGSGPRRCLFSPGAGGRTMSAGRLRPVLATSVQVTLDPEFLAHMPELHGIQQAPVLREVTQGSPTRLGEVSARPTSINPQFHQTTLDRGAHAGGSFGSPAQWPPRHVRSRMPSAAYGYWLNCMHR